MKSEKGQSLVEFALTLPILLLLLFGITDFGRIFHVYLTLDHLGREGARMASVGQVVVSDTCKSAVPTDASLDEQIKAALRCSSNLDEAKLSINITYPEPGSRKSGESVSVEISYRIDFLTPFMNSIIPNFKLTDTTIMRVE